MTKGDRFINCVSLELYTYEGVDYMGNLIMLNSANDTRNVGEGYFYARYIPYSESKYLELKNKKYKEKRGRLCDKNVDGIE